MWNSLSKLKALLEARERRKIVAITLLMTFTAFIQTAGIASVMPFLAVVSDPEIIRSNTALDFIYGQLEFTSAQSFLYFLGVCAFSVFSLGILLQAYSHWVVTRFSQTQQYHLSRRLMADYLRRPYAFFLTRNSSDLAKTVLQETSHAVNGVLLPAMRLLGHVLLAIAVVVLLVVMEPLLAITVAFAIGASYGALYVFSRLWLERIGKDRVKANRERFTASAEAFNGAKEIRLLGREAEYLERYRLPSLRYAMHQANANLLATLPQYAMEAVAFGGILIVVLFLMSGEAGVAGALPLIGLYGLAGKQLIPAINKIFSAVAEIRFNMPSVDTVLDDLGDRVGSRPLPDSSAVPIPLIPAENIILDGITFSYLGADEPALRDIHLQVRANSTVGFVGASGAGKSTLIDIILGLLGPDSGEIRIDDVPLTTANIPQWQATLGYVPQHIFLADDSVIGNIALGIPLEQIDHSAVERAAKLANLHEFVTSELPEGYGTFIGERGVRLSGGQRQRIGIARALYRDPSVLIFDEATSALDNVTERAVMDAIHNLSGQKTIFLVAHRLTTVRNCDKVIVFSSGRVVEEGTWDELSSSGAQFKHLASLS